MARAPGQIASRMRKLREVGVLLTLSAIMVAGAKAALAPHERIKELKGETRARVMKVFSDEEPGRRVMAVRMFPGDLWSQGDAFGGREAEIVRQQTALHRVALESVLDVIDADMHARRIPGRIPGAPPCKPRPQYD